MYLPQLYYDTLESSESLTDDASGAASSGSHAYTGVLQSHDMYEVLSCCNLRQ